MHHDHGIMTLKIVIISSSDNMLEDNVQQDTFHKGTEKKAEIDRETERKTESEREREREREGERDKETTTETERVPEKAREHTVSPQWFLNCKIASSE